MMPTTQTANQRLNALATLRKALGKPTDGFAFRVSMGVDLDRVLRFGSSRKGFSPLAWKERDSFPGYTPLSQEIPVQHDAFTIASPWSELWEDAAHDDGTLAHKLKIYEKPFVTVYALTGLRFVGKEKSASLHNQGTHYEFIGTPLEALDSVWRWENVSKSEH